MPNQVTISKELYNSKKAVAIASQPIRKTVGLNTIKLLNDTTVMVEGKEMKISPAAFVQFARLLGIPAQFSGRFADLFGETARQQFINRMKDAVASQKTEFVTIVGSRKTKEIIAIHKAEKGFISNAAFFHTLENILSDGKLSLVDFHCDQDGQIQLNTVADVDFQVGGHKDEFFRGGIGMGNSYKDGMIFAPYVNRLSCLNGMVGDHFEEKTRINSLAGVSMEKFLKELDSLAKRGYKPMLFDEVVQRAMSTPASLLELEGACDFICTSSGIEKEKANKWIPLLSTQEAYTAAGINPFTMNFEQKKNAKTGTTLWQVINGMTDFATHDHGIKVEDWNRNTIQKEAGKILAKQPDMANIVKSPF